MNKISISILSIISLISFSCNKSMDNDPGDQDSYNNDLPSSIILKDLPSGTFTMGGSTMSNDSPEVSVSISSFKISEKEITNSEYLLFLNAAYTDGWIEIVEEQLSDPCGQYKEYVIKAKDEAPFAGEIYLQLAESGGCTSEGEEEHINNKSWITFNQSIERFELLDESKANWPVNWIKWYGAYAFTQYYNVDLPSEAQWEYAARAGQQLDYPTDDGTLSSEKANYNGDIPGVFDPDGHSVAVASYPANPFGLYDMGGNVWEWCLDYYQNDFYMDKVTDPLNTNPGSESKRVRRGGSWNYHSATLLTYARASDFENRGNNHFGFRIVKN